MAMAKAKAMAMAMSKAMAKAMAKENQVFRVHYTFWLHQGLAPTKNSKAR